MKAEKILSNMFVLPGMPWGVDTFFGRVLWNLAEERNEEFIDVTHHFDPCKKYFVAWARQNFATFIDMMGPHDLLIINGPSKKYCWEIED